MDLATGRVAVAAEKDGRRIAVAIRNFLSPSSIRDLPEAVGQFEIYRAVLAEMDPDRHLYRPVPRRVWTGLLAESFGQLIIDRLTLRLLVFEEQQEAAGDGLQRLRLQYSALWAKRVAMPSRSQLEFTQ